VSISSQAQNWETIPLRILGDSSVIIGRTVTVTGAIVSSTTGEPIVGASISVDLHKYFDYTDASGKYLIELPAGKHRMMIRHVGMQSVFYNLQVTGPSLFNVKLTEGVTDLDEVVVTARAIDSNIKETIAGISKISVVEMKSLPTFAGEVDILKSIQTLPGVSSVGEGSSGFNVRGGRTDQNLMLFDGIPLFNASHALGFLSGFNQDVVKDFTLYKGNVPAQLGGRASSVLEINTRQGDFEKWQYQGGLGAVSGRFTAEGPIVANKTSLIAGGRLSYSDWVLRRVDNPDVKNSSMQFYDANIGVTHRFSENSVLRLTTYASRDYFKFSQQFAYEWQNYLAGLEWKSRADKKLSPTITASYGQYGSTLINPSGLEASQLTNKLHYVQGRAGFQFIPDEKHTITAGVETTAYLPEEETMRGYNGNDALLERVAPKNHGVEGGLYVNEEFEISKSIGLSAGLRYSIYNHIGAATQYDYSETAPRSSRSIIDSTVYGAGQKISSFAGLEPRISFRFTLSETQSIKLGYNRMRQYIHQISNTTAPTPVDVWQVSTKYLQPQVADNYSLGYFLNLNTNTYETSIEAFYKKMNNLVEYKNFPELFVNPHIETELLSGEGYAYGGEAYIRKLRGLWTGWISYTYSQTLVRVVSPFPGESINNGEWFPSNYNKPHVFNLVATRKGFQKNGAISFIIAYNTGRPLTALETSYISSASVVPVYSARNKYTIPNYFRFDMSFTIGNIIDKFDDSLVFSVYNLFGRDNAYSVFYQRPANNFFIPKAYKLAVLGAAMPSLTYNFKL
jgi:hypothetical protein